MLKKLSNPKENTIFSITAYDAQDIVNLTGGETRPVLTYTFAGSFPQLRSSNTYCGWFKSGTLSYQQFSCSYRELAPDDFLLVPGEPMHAESPS